MSDEISAMENTIGEISVPDSQGVTYVELGLQQYGDGFGVDIENTINNGRYIKGAITVLVDDAGNRTYELRYRHDSDKNNGVGNLVREVNRVAVLDIGAQDNGHTAVEMTVSDASYLSTVIRMISPLLNALDKNSLLGIKVKDKGYIFNGNVKDFIKEYSQIPFEQILKDILPEGAERKLNTAWGLATCFEGDPTRMLKVLADLYKSDKARQFVVRGAVGHNGKIIFSADPFINHSDLSAFYKDDVNLYITSSYSHGVYVLELIGVNDISDETIKDLIILLQGFIEDKSITSKIKVEAIRVAGDNIEQSLSDPMDI